MFFPRISPRTFAVLALIAVALFLWLRPSAPAGTSAMIQGKAWNFSLPRAEDRTASLSLNDFHGKVRLLVFWATWCTPCLMEIPTLNRLQQEFGPQGLQIIGINVDEEPRDALPALIKRLDISYPVVLGNATVVEHYGGFRSIPMAFLVGRQGEFLEVLPGLIPESQLRSRLEKAL